MAAALLLGLTLLLPARDVGAQDFGVRGWAGSNVQAVRMRPLQVDPAGCVPNAQCYTPLGKRTSFAATQDVSLTAWGFGVTGLSATMYLRGRAGLGDDFAWPRSDDHFDALLGYAQLARGGWTLRVGRQEARSGLGFSSFDGGSAAWRVAWAQLEGYAGRSLARGLRDPANEALAGIEDFVPDESVWLFGGAARARFRTGSMTVRYQRELLADRSGLASERASVDGSATLSSVRLGAGADWDFGRGQAGKAHLTASMPFGARWVLAASARRYVPYFSLSTIWGFFEPVAYHEAQLRASWSATSALGLWVSGGWRKYGDTRTVAVLSSIEDTGWRGEAGVMWMPGPAWTVDGGWHLEWGPGGFLNSADASVRRSFGDRLGVAVSGTSFQQIEQYRLGDGRAWGGTVSVDAEVVDRFTLLMGGSVIRHTTSNDGIDRPWNQMRAWSSVRVALGSDPGRANRMRR